MFFCGRIMFNYFRCCAFCRLFYSPPTSKKRAGFAFILVMTICFCITAITLVARLFRPKVGTVNVSLDGAAQEKIKKKKKREEEEEEETAF